jgi:hypothetical protein
VTGWFLLQKALPGILAPTVFESGILVCLVRSQKTGYLYAH